MNKFSLVIATMLLFSAIVNAQTYPKCDVCKGNKTVFKKSGVKQECNNCKDWAESYRNKVPCYICKNKRYVFGPGYEYCKKCYGTGKGAEQRNKEYKEAVKFFEDKEAAYRNSMSYRLSNLEILPDGHIRSKVDFELLDKDNNKDRDAKIAEIKRKKDEKINDLEDELSISLSNNDNISKKIQEKNISNSSKQKSKLKIDDYYITVNSHDINIKSKNSSTVIIDNNGGVNLYDKILSEQEKEALKIENWKTISYAKCYKNNRGDVIEVKLKNKYASIGDKSRHYQFMDGEAFELAKRYVHEAKERLRYD